MEQLTKNKRFILTDNGYIYDQKEGSIHQVIESVVKQLNELSDKNEQLKQTIQEAYETERTAIGRSVLKQLLEAIQ